MGSSESSSSKRRIPWWLWPILIIAIVFGSWIIWNFQMDAAIERELQAIRDAGYPATLKHLEASYVYPDGDNAALVYDKAFALLIESGGAEGELLPIFGTQPPLDPTQAMPGDVTVAVERFLGTNQAALDKLHEAAHIVPSRYPIDLTKGVALSLTHLSKARMAASALCIEAMRRADRGDTDGAIDSLIAALAVGRSLRHEPIVVSHLVEISVMALAYQKIEHLVQRIDLSKAQRGRLATASNATWLDDAMAEAMAGERIGFYPYLSHRDIYDPWWRSVYDYSGLLKRDQRLYLDVMRQYVEAAELPPTQQIAAFKSVDVAARATPLSFPIASRTMPTLGKAMIIHHRVIASRTLTLVALALLDYHEAKGRLPDKLDDLVPDYLDDVPLDTFTGKPIEYQRVNDDSFILFTPGELGVTVPAEGDPSRIGFIRDLEDYKKFEYRVPAGHPLRAVEVEVQE